MRYRSVLVVVLALTFGVSAAIGINTMMRATGATPVETVPVVVAAADVGRFTVLTEDKLAVRDFPKDHVPPGSLHSTEDAIGRVTAGPLFKDEQVLDAKLAPRGSSRGMAAAIPKGMQAITIQTPNVASGVAGFVAPGNKVNVLLTVNWRERSKTREADDTNAGGSTITLLQGVEILAVDQRLEAPADNKVDPKELRSVTLLVTPEQGAKLTLGQYQGTLHLALRNPHDDQPASIRPVTLADFKFYQESPWRGLAALTTKGMRAITIKTFNVASGVGGLIVPGNKVDVLLTGNVGTTTTVSLPGAASRQGLVPKCITLLQNVKIMAVDSRVDAVTDKDEARAVNSDPKIETKQMEYLNVTLLVMPEQANALALAQDLGKLYLVLRNPEDEEVVVDARQPEPKAEEKKAVVPAAAEANPAPLPAALAPPIRTLRGNIPGAVELR